MSKCSESEAAALDQAGPLLRFAAEHVRDLDPTLSLAVAQAREEAGHDKWTPETSQKFWGAYAKLCDLILPVSMDCLEATQPSIKASGWLPFASGKTISLAQRSSGRYVTIMVVLLAIILVLQLYVWTCLNLSQKIDDFASATSEKLAPVEENYIKLRGEITGLQLGENARLPAAQQVQADKIPAFTNSLSLDCDRLLSETNLLENVMSGFIFARPLEPFLSQLKGFWDTDYLDVVDRFYKLRVQALQVQESANLAAGILNSFVLPVLFGTIGAVAYVIRTISDQIRTTTFFLTSPTRHLMRVALGALAGLVVGLFSRLSTQLSLPPLAIAFLAGYGVEALFSMFDGLIDKFRQVSAETSPSRSEVHARPHPREPKQ
jgi:hypothetical protein